MDFLHQWTIRTKIVVIVNFLLFFAISLSGYGLNELRLVDSEVEAVVQENVPFVQSLSQLLSVNMKIVVLFERIAKHGLTAETKKESSDKTNAYIDEFRFLDADSGRHIDEIRELLKKIGNSTVEQQKLKEIKDALQAVDVIQTFHDDLGKNLAQLLSYFRDNQIQKALAITEQTETATVTANQTLEKLFKYSATSAGITISLIDDRVSKAVSYVALLLFVGIVLSVPLVWVMTNSITDPLKKLIDALRQAAFSGDFSARVPVPGSNELSQLGEIFNRMAQNAEDQAWLKSAATSVSAILQTMQNPKDLADALLAFFGDHLRCGFGLFYLHNEHNGRYEQAGSYRISGQSTRNFSYGLGEGMVGQCAKEGRLMVLSDVPDTYYKVQSALGEALPKGIMVIPIKFQERVLGVMEIAAFHNFKDVQKTLLKEQIPNVAVGLDNLLSSLKTKTLLKQTQEQREELILQSEELKLSNEELEEQAKSLRTAQEELQAQQVTLEKNNRELEKSQQEIAKKADDLAQASRYKSQFLANMSHELRTPLNSLLILSKGFADNEDGNLTDDQVESAQVIHDSGFDLLNLINDILDMSKIEAGKMEPHLEVFALSEFLNDMRRRFQPMAQKKGLDWQTVVDKNVPGTLLCDRGMLLKIVRNFLSNAFKFTERGGVSLELFLLDNQIAFKVKDSGIGIAPDKIKMIFEPFQQADGTTARRFGGTGLGLSIAREMANLLGGEIQVKSEENQGSVFTLLLPVGNSAQVDDGSIKNLVAGTGREKWAFSDRVTEQTPKERRQTCPIKGLFGDDQEKGETLGELLLIEDDNHFSHIVANFAKEKGWTCRVATSGREGLAMVARWNPVGIILDLGLPDMSGHEVLDRLKANPKTAGIPVHIITSMDSDKRLDFEKGAVGSLQKPITKGELASVLDMFNCCTTPESASLLLVEDDPWAREAITALLENAGIDVTIATTGLEAFRLIKKQNFRCVILDLGIPDLDGFALLEKIKEDPDIVMPPVIIHSGAKLTREEYARLREYTDAIVTKGAVSSQQRLLDEVRSFLGLVNGSVADKVTVSGKEDKNWRLRFKGLNVLLVDDDMRNTFALSRVLEKKGLSVVISPDGQSAIDLLEHSQDVINAVIMDTMMPGIDGNETTRRIRQNSRFENLPIIVLSAKAMQEDQEIALASGADHFLGKPVDLDILLETLDRLFIERSNL